MATLPLSQPIPRLWEATLYKALDWPGNLKKICLCQAFYRTVIVLSNPSTLPNFIPPARGIRGWQQRGRLGWETQQPSTCASCGPYTWTPTSSSSTCGSPHNVSMRIFFCVDNTCGNTYLWTWPSSAQKFYGNIVCGSPHVTSYGIFFRMEIFIRVLLCHSSYDRPCIQISIHIFYMDFFFSFRIKSLCVGD